MAAIHRPRGWRSCRWGIVLVGAAVLSIGQIARAQWDNAPPTAAERDKLYKELADESNSLQREANVLRKCVQLVKPAVVHIDSEHSSTLSRYHREVDEEAGSGTIIESGGKFYVLTNRHVVENAAADSIKIRLADGRELSPMHIWMDKPTDIAVLGIEAPNLVAARIGNAADIDIGDFVLAVGSPFGLSHSVTLGIISAKGRRDLQLEGLKDDAVKFQNFLQTDAAINPGNSGGPLVNIKGEVIGMNTAIASSSNGSEGIGFTIPIDMAMFVADQLIEHGTVTRAYLGVKFYDPKKDKDKFTSAEFIRIGLTHPCGARISGTTAKSPADLARLQPDDVIVEFNRVPVEDDSHLMCLVSLMEVGKEVPIVVYRNHQTQNLTIKLAERPLSE